MSTVYCVSPRQDGSVIPVPVYLLESSFPNNRYNSVVLSASMRPVMTTTISFCLRGGWHEKITFLKNLDSDFSHGKELTDFFSRIFCGHFHGQKLALAISHLWTSTCGKT